VWINALGTFSSVEDSKFPFQLSVDTIEQIPEKEDPYVY
jgi:uncharacterized membrane protein YcgQ (UPF0703/DUF1980 family)